MGSRLPVAKAGTTPVAADNDLVYRAGQKPSECELLASVRSSDIIGRRPTRSATLKLYFEKLRLFCRRWNRWAGVKPSVSGYQVGGHRHAGRDGTRGRADSYQYRRESDPKNA
jgi:hypothetical protein